MRPALVDDYLRPILRGGPGNGLIIVGCDPREAAFILEHGCRIDGAFYAADLGAFSGLVDGDGRITLRLHAGGRDDSLGARANGAARTSAWRRSRSRRACRSCM